MKVAIVARLFAKWNVDVNAAHRICIQYLVFRFKKRSAFSLPNLDLNSGQH
jgi:hypothetical protein